MLRSAANFLIERLGLRFSRVLMITRTPRPFFDLGLPDFGRALAVPVLWIRLTTVYTLAGEIFSILAISHGRFPT